MPIRWFLPTEIYSHIPKTLRPWLLGDGSLTEQLIQLSDAQFSVEVVAEHFCLMTLDQQRFLQQRAKQVAWERQAILYGKKMPWVHANSVFPIKSLQRGATRFRYLKQLPIGKVLFFRYQPRCIRYVGYDGHHWSRRSIYDWHGQPILIQEQFSSEFMQWLVDDAE